MQFTITVEAETLAGAVSKLLASVRAEAIRAVLAGAKDVSTAEVSALEQPEDLKPAEKQPSLDDITAALRDIVVKGGPVEGVKAGQALLSEFGARSIGGVPEDRRGEFLAKAKEVLR
jgi:hypothetical protein